MWHYGSGFPKSHNIGKAIDKAAGAKREVVEVAINGVGSPGFEAKDRGSVKPAGLRDAVYDITAPATPEAQQWQGWGTALKPATEIVTMARKPFKGTVAACVLEHGTGALNVDGCRVAYRSKDDMEQARVPQLSMNTTGEIYNMKTGVGRNGEVFDPSKGRWPANLIHDGSDEVVGLFPETTPAKQNLQSDNRSQVNGSVALLDTRSLGMRTPQNSHNDTGGSAARFFYCPKANKRERGEDNNHPTVKPIALMAYLCRLVTPPSGIVLDPFMGSGSTGIAALQEGFDFIGIEREAEYVDIAKSRIEKALGQG
jgi:site-specific DNA-methyltransferase (adenine-specific)